jgi:hypothetical protein
MLSGTVSHRGVVSETLRDVAVAFLYWGRVTVLFQGSCFKGPCHRNFKWPCRGGLVAGASSHGPGQRDLARWTLARRRCHRNLSDGNRVTETCHGDFGQRDLSRGPCHTRSLLKGPCHEVVITEPCHGALPQGLVTGALSRGPRYGGLVTKTWSQGPYLTGALSRGARRRDLVRGCVAGPRRRVLVAGLLSQGSCHKNLATKTCHENLFINTFS